MVRNILVFLKSLKYNNVSEYFIIYYHQNILLSKFYLVENSQSHRKFFVFLGSCVTFLLLLPSNPPPPTVVIIILNNEFLNKKDRKQAGHSLVLYEDTQLQWSQNWQGTFLIFNVLLSFECAYFTLATAGMMALVTLVTGSSKISNAGVTNDGWFFFLKTLVLMVWLLLCLIFLLGDLCWFSWLFCQTGTIFGLTSYPDVSRKVFICCFGCGFWLHCCKVKQTILLYYSWFHAFSNTRNKKK